MKKIDNFINKYSLSKTLRFQLIPIGKTEDNFNKKLVLDADEKRAENYSKVKGYLDRYYRAFIETCLNKVMLTGITEYSQYYFQKNKDDTVKNAMTLLETDMRNQIADSFERDNDFVSLFDKDVITKLLPKFLENEEEFNIVNSFNNFTSYFYGFFENRKNIFTEEEKSTGVAYRCINDNLPKFLDNVHSYQIIKSEIKTIKEKTDKRINELCSYISNNIADLDDLFKPSVFTFILSQSAVEIFNKIIGGYTDSDGNKIQGINECVNLYNQQNRTRLPLLKPLYKQILSENESLSFVLDKFVSDDELLTSVNKAYSEGDHSIAHAVKEIEDIFSIFGDYDLKGIHIINGLPITDISNAVSGNWHTVQDSWNAAYDTINLKSAKKVDDTYIDKRAKEYKKIKSFNLEEIQCYGGKEAIADYYRLAVKKYCKDINDCFTRAKDLLSNPYKEEKRIYRNDTAIALIKDFLDSIKALEKIVKPLLGTGKEEYKDEMFYGAFLPYYIDLSVIDRLYDKVRNYLTQKPYSTDKIKLNFNNVQLLGGWDKNKERDCCSVIFRKEEKYYLGILDKNSNKIFEDYPYKDGEDYYEKMIYKYLPDPSKMLPKVFFAKKNIDYFNPSKHILDIREKGSYKKGKTFNINDCHEFIDFYKDSIAKHSEWVDFGFKFSNTNSYTNIGEFFKEVKNQGYSLRFDNVSATYIDNLIDQGKLYLFQIYSKDFSEHSKGMPNLHTMYFKMLFEEKNLSDVVFKLNGESEMFYRKPSISEEEKIIHLANNPIANKNPDNNKKTSIFAYDLVKDRRYTKSSFLLHLPIGINFKAEGNDYINDEVRKSIRKCPENYVIGIDRGERNLLYICVINPEGKIVEQFSLNQIINEYQGKQHVIDYHRLLDEKEKQRDTARQNWTAVENIKELKEGYLSQVVHKICELVEKYDAVIAMEDLNSGFKNGRKKVEKQVYQKFEKALIDKLDFMADKKKEPDVVGGLLRAYQLANNGPKYVNRGIQNGFIFYVPAWLTSKIDPVTGFVNLMDTRYSSIETSKSFLGLFESIGYDKDEDMFKFDFDYNDFPKGSTSSRCKWTIYSNATRIKSFRNPNNNNEWDNEEIVLTDEFKKLFVKYGIELSANMKDSILKINEADFYKSILGLLKLILQMRNSITGRTDMDYMISPVKSSDGRFYDSRDYENIEDAALPQNADANGAYNIARKGLYFINQLKQCDENGYEKAKLSITNKEWLEFAQNND